MENSKIGNRTKGKLANWKIGKLEIGKKGNLENRPIG